MNGLGYYVAKQRVDSITALHPAPVILVAKSPCWWTNCGDLDIRYTSGHQDVLPEIINEAGNLKIAAVSRGWKQSTTETANTLTLFAYLRSDEVASLSAALPGRGWIAGNTTKMFRPCARYLRVVVWKCSAVLTSNHP